jgi:hypothetical protein
MNCWTCGRPASGICSFCGRAVCKDDAQQVPSIVALYSQRNGDKMAIVVPDALHCGVCHPKGEPVPLKELD